MDMFKNPIRLAFFWKALLYFFYYLREVVDNDRFRCYFRPYSC